MSDQVRKLRIVQCPTPRYSREFKEAKDWLLERASAMQRAGAWQTLRAHLTDEEVLYLKLKFKGIVVNDG